MKQATDFTQYPHSHLYAMLHAADEAGVRSAADAWDGIGARLHEQAGTLESRLARFRDRWRGTAADQYQLMIRDLGAGLRRIADTAFTLRDLSHQVADALVKAKAEMPVPVELPQLSPATAQLAAAPIEVSAFTPTETVARLQQLRAEAVAAVQAHQQAAQVASAAHARAVAVMSELAGEYRTTDQAIPASPEARQAASGGRAGVDDWLRQRDPADSSWSPPDRTGTGGTTPVFSGAFTAGLGAASAAVTRQLVPALPKVPDWAATKPPAAVDTPDGNPTSPTPGTPVPSTGGGLGGLGLGAGLGGAALGSGIGGGGKGEGGVVKGGIGAAAKPVAGVGMTGAGPTPNAAAAALGATAGAARAGASAAPMMPMMPFAPMGSDLDGGRRIPPWLTETEDVWGEPQATTPPVIGAADEYPQPGYPY